MMREPADRSRPRPRPGEGWHITLISVSGQGETDGPRVPHAGKRHLAISNSRRPRRSRVDIRARLRQPYGERLAPHSAGRSHDMPPHVPIGVGFRRWRGKVKRCVCNAGRVVASVFVGGRSTTIIAGPVDRHCRALSGWARSYSVWTGPIVDALPILRISME